MILLLFLLIPVFLSAATTCFRGGPYLQELSHNGVTIVFENSVPTFAWVELRKKGQSAVTKYYQEVEGQHQIYDYLQAPSVSLPVQNFRIRISSLENKTTYEYRVCSQKIEQMKPYSAKLSTQYESDWYEFTTLDSKATEHHLLVVSDMLGRTEMLKKFLDALDYQTADHIIYAGDMMENMQVGKTSSTASKCEEPYTSFINSSVELFATRQDFNMLRGDHETKGDAADYFSTYFPHQSGKNYNAYRWGDLEIVLLDSGEDKLDNHQEYYGMASFYSYREEMARWFEELIKTDEFRTAKYRIVICHFTLLMDDKKPTDEFGGEPQLISLILPLLKQCDIDMLISGHYHPKTYTYIDKNYKNKGNQFEEYNIGAHSGMRIDIADGNIHLKIVSTKGVVLLDKMIRNGKAEKKLIYITTGLDD